MKHAENDYLISHDLVGNSLVAIKQDKYILGTALTLVSRLGKFEKRLSPIVDSGYNRCSRIGIVERDVLEYVL